MCVRLHLLLRKNFIHSQSLLVLYPTCTVHYTVYTGNDKGKKQKKTSWLTALLAGH